MEDFSNNKSIEDSGDFGPIPTAKKGGWITLPFILATVAGLSMAYGGLVSNLEVYLIQEFNIERISAAKIYNATNAIISILPVAAAILADSFLGCYSVIWISSSLHHWSVLLLLILTAALSKLRPPPCESGSSDPCKTPTLIQHTALYLGLGLVSVGLAGTRFTVGSIGAYQFDKSKQQGVFFNWFTFVIYISYVMSSTAIVYVESYVSWAWGFGICFATNTLALMLFLAGTSFYRQMKPHGSPFASLARVVVAAVRKSGVTHSHNPDDYCQGHDYGTPALPTKFLWCLNGAAFRTEWDIGQQGKMTKSWKLCTVTEVEDFKCLIKLVPLWISSLIVSTPLVIQLSMVNLQALSMDRHLGQKLEIPAGTMPIFIFMSTCITIFFVDRLLLKMWNKITCKPISPLQRVGIGHVLNVVSMAVLALVEAKRLKMARLHNLQGQDINAVVPMSIFWLVPSLALAGIGEGFHFPGQISFYYKEFPKHLKSTSTAVFSLCIGIGFYMGNGSILHVYWLVTALGGINFCYFLLCTSLYK
ncbi:OLC1v1024564C1 [Oldenlandia corymbosa var. corymbosa]|uniref:OLC1v1024564C1 n=1 Tax=Oldenlandia corymbosa var. corymbosa TaxID=529605 RepID=A0AAV1C646_OLDCO|nr:OLC1v1024564C1 [Oldenlandia corymbosa var. corymbosa]